MNLLDAIEVATGPTPRASVIWLHGLGADGHDFEPIVPDLVAPHERAVRFIFPHAPLRAVTVNGGYTMRAWYDIAALGAHAQEDLAGLGSARKQIDALINRELERGVTAEHIALAGFSQGGALALYTGTRFTHRLAGIVGLSCYLPAADRLPQEHSEASLATPIFMAHGQHARWCFRTTANCRAARWCAAAIRSSGISIRCRTRSVPRRSPSSRCGCGGYSSAATPVG
jgi:phospholipase/carboxylesterase